jgi:hypothetical protein
MPPDPMRTDLHQHLLPEDLIAALARRSEAPRIVKDGRAYGPLALDAMIRVIGIDRLVYGSDRPVAAPPTLSVLGGAAEHAIKVTNPEWALAARVPVAVLA